MTNFHRYLLAVCLFFTSSLALAEGFYVGAGAYSANIDESGIDDDDMALAAFVGWRPIELLGIEVGYFDLGSYEVGIDDLDASAYTLAGVLTFDLGPVGLYGKLGLAETELEVGLDDDSEAEPFGTLGAYVDIMDTVYIYAELMRIQAEVDIDLIGAGVRVDF